MIVNPFTLYQNSKTLFTQNVSTLTIKIKMGLLVFIVAIIIDNVFVISHSIIVNSKIDTIKHLSEVSNKQYIDEDYDLLNQEITNYQNIFAKTVESFSLYTNNENRTPVINTFTVSILPILLFIILCFHFIEEIAIKRENQIERLVNIALLLACAFVLFHVMLSCSYVIPTVPEGYVWANYLLNLFLTLILYLLICGIISNLSKNIPPNSGQQINNNQSDVPEVAEETEEPRDEEAADAAPVLPHA